MENQEIQNREVENKEVDQDTLYKNAFINGLKEKVKNDKPYSSFMGIERIKTIIDDIFLNIVIYHMKGRKDDVDLFKIMIEDEYMVYDHCYTSYSYTFYIGDKDEEYMPYKHYEVNNDDEMDKFWNLLKKIKTYKYNKVLSRFEPNEIIESTTKYNESINYLFEQNICVVCNDMVGEEEITLCNHNLCKKCLNNMLKKKNRKCPICRAKKIEVVKNDNVDSESDNE
jgi:hypothetical protein